MRVALLSSEGGGISSVCHGLAQSLSERKIETTIFSATASRQPKVEKVNDYLEVVYLPLINCPPRALWFYFTRSYNLSALLKQREPYTLIHGVCPEMSIVYTLIRKGSKTPLITTLHGSHVAALKAFVQSPMKNWALSDFAFHVLELPLHNMTTRGCFAKSNRIVVCSFNTLNELVRYERFDTSKVSVIYNGVNLKEIQQEEPEIGNKKVDSDHELTMIYAGRLFWMKGITFVLGAYEDLRRQFKDLQLKIFGKGPLENEIKRFVANRRLKDCVHFGGFLPNRKLIREIKKSDIVVFPSLYESQPMFALESMACKKPLIGFNLSYAREIIKDGQNGLLAKAYDTKDLSNKIRMALEDKKLRQKLGENAYRHIKSHHNWDTQVGKYIELYQNAIEQIK